MRQILTTLRVAQQAIDEAIEAIEGIGYVPIPGIPDYERNGMKIRHKTRSGYKPIKLNQQMFSAHGKRFYVPVKDGEIKQIK